MTIIAPEDFRSRLVQGMLSSGCRVDEHDFQLDFGPRTAAVSIGGGELETRRHEVRISHRGEAELRTMLGSLREWWKLRQWNEAVLSAHDFLFGSDGGKPRSYLVETALIQLLDGRGIDMLHFRDAMASHIGRRRRSPEQIKAAIGQVWSSFPAHNRPAIFEEWCWRSGTAPAPAAFHDAGDMQFRLVGRSGWGLMPFIELAPHVMWVGGPGTAIWIKQELVPQALMNAAKGRPVTDVIGHPALDVPGLKVTGMQHVFNKASGKHRTVVTINAVKQDATALVARMEEERRPAKAA